MENISLKLETTIAKQIDKRMREFNYSTKTEFIREAIRDKLSELSKEAERKKAFTALYKARGIFKGQGKAKTDAEFRELRTQAGTEYIAELEKEFSKK
ncbi:MAG: ribbon-helix-helix domain-containing protein [archaeon]|jgi:metal-responsive CopG/Arc/MetJ family transcriptional regulator